MNSLQDAIYNWLSIKVVADERSEDYAAKETEQMFYQILVEEHGITNIDVKKDESMYYVTVDKNDQKRSYRFPKELIENMIQHMKNEPDKFQNYPLE